MNILLSPSFAETVYFWGVNSEAGEGLILRYDRKTLCGHLEEEAVSPYKLSQLRYFLSNQHISGFYFEDTLVFINKGGLE